MFPKVLLCSEVSYSVKMLPTLLCIEMHTDINKKGEKQNRDIYSNGRFVDVKSVSVLLLSRENQKSFC